ncbi:DUF2284 domain-containing protein [Methanospirillum sp.]
MRVIPYEDLKIFIDVAKEEGVEIVNPIFVDQIIFDFRTTYKCMSCKKYGKKPTCPPNIPDFEYFKKLIRCYKFGLIIGKKYCYSNNDDFNKVRSESGPRLQNILLSLEQQAFQRNYYWAISFIGGSCRGCKACDPQNPICQTPERGRIPMEAIGIDVVKTCQNMGISISPFPLSVEGGILYRIGLFLLE